MGISPDIELLFGVKGGGSVAGASGKKIQNQINNIVGTINKNSLGLKVTLDKSAAEKLKEEVLAQVKTVKIESFDSSAAISKLKADIESALSGVSVGGSSSSTSTGTTGSANQSTSSSATAQTPDLQRAINQMQAAADSFTNAQTTLAGIVASASSDGGGGSSGGGSTRNATATLQQIASLRKKVESLLRNNSRAANTGYSVALNSALQQLDGREIDTEKFARLKREIAGIELNLKNAGLQGKSFWSVLKAGYEKFGGWALITRSMTAAINSVRQMISNVTELDSAMVELRKVTDESESTYENFFDEATVRANKLGATVTDTINASADFARLGYSLEDAATLADTAIMYKNVGDGITDISVASQSIISTLKGFNLEASDATHVIDAFNEVGNNFPISSAGIGDALTRSAAALSAANNTMEESIALITAMNTTLQDPEKVGTTIKTVTMYLRAAKAELEEAGEDTDGLANSTSELRESVLALTGQQVDIMLNASTFKSTYQIIKEISEVWSSMVDVDQAALLELLGGKRNSNAVASLIANFDTAEEALKSATNSAGSAAAENEKYLDSIRGKVAQLNAAFETLSATVIDSDFAKGVVDSGTDILNVITAIVDKIGTLSTLAAGASAALTFGKVNSLLSPIQTRVVQKENGAGGTAGSFSIGWTNSIKIDKGEIDKYNDALTRYKQAIVAAKGDKNKLNAANEQFNGAVDEIIPNVSRLTGELINTSRANGKLAQQIPNTTGAILKFKASAIAAKVASAALNAVIAAGVSIAIQYAIKGLDYLIHREERIAEAAEEAKGAISDITSELDTLRSSTSNAEATLEAFGDQVQYINGHLTSQTLSAEQLEQYSEAVKTLTEQYPELISGYDSEGNALIDLSQGYETLKEQIEEAYKAKLLLANIELDNDMPAVVKGAVTSANNLRSQLAAIQNEIAFAESLDSSIDTPLISTHKLSDGVLAQMLHGKNAVEMIVDTSGLATELQKAISADNGKWFGDNGYYDVKIDSNGNGAVGAISQIYSDRSNGKQLTQKALEQYIDYLGGDAIIGEYEQKAAKLEQQIKAVWSETNQNLLSYFSTDESFTKVNTAFGGLLGSIINNADWGTLIDENASWEEIKDYVNTNLVAVFDDISLSAKADMRSLLSGDIAAASVSTYSQVMNRVQNALLTATRGNTKQVEQIMDALEGTMEYTEERINDIQNAVLGEDSDGNTAVIDAFKQKCEGLVEVLEGDDKAISETETQFEEFIKGLTDGTATIAELQAALELVQGNSLSTCNSFEELKEHYDSLVESLSGTRSYNDIVESFGDLAAVTDNAYKAYVRLHGAISQSDYSSWELNDYRNQSVKDYEEFKKLHDEGLIGTGQYRQYLDYFGLKNSAEADEFFKNQGDWYAEGAEGINAFLNAVSQADLGDLASVEWLENGVDFKFDINRLDEFAEAMGMTEEQLWNMIRAYRAYCENWESMSPTEVVDELKELNIMSDSGEVSYEKMAEYTGLSMAEIEKLLNTLREAGFENIHLNLGLSGELEKAGDDIEAINAALAKMELPTAEIDGEALQITQDIVDAMREQMSDENLWELLTAWDSSDKIQLAADLEIDGTNVRDKLKEIQQQIDEDNTATVTITMDDATSEQVNALAEKLKELGLKNTEIKVTDNTIKVKKKLEELLELVAKLNSSNIDLNTSVGESGGSVNKNATGTNSAAPGYSLLGDEKSGDGSPRPELVVTDDGAHIAGLNGPTVEYLNAGDRVYTYSETKKILGGRNGTIRLPAFSGGTSSGNGNFYQIGAGSLWSSAMSSSNAPGSDFESRYKHHQHLLKMEQESEKDYLDWLDKAYKDAYANGEIELDDYYKYQEEVFSLIRELAEDNLSDAEHYIEMLGHYDGNDAEIIATYRELMSAIEKEIASARAAGLDDNSEYIQSLQDKWWGFYDTIEDIQDEIADNAKDAAEELIDLRVKMIKQDLKNEKEALEEKKSALKEFYDKQKELLQDAYDEDEYLDEQAAKRKAVADLQMQLNQLEYDDSAQAQKKKLELMQELKEAQKELDDFEKEHALKKTQELIDDTQEAQEKEIDNEIELIEEKEDNAKLLRDQAISDLRNATSQLYEDMIAWNDKYGSAISQDITEKWEDAVSAMSNYFKLNQKYYEGIDISQGVYPEFLKSNGTWSSNPVSGDNPANQAPASADSSSTSGGSTGSVSGIQRQLSYGSRGDDVKSLQTALQSMGYYGGEIDGIFGSGTQSAVRAFQSTEGISADGIVGPNTKEKFKLRGYASGTANATAGIHEIWEDGSEYIFTSSNGKTYRVFSDGEKVLNANATKFLYDFANNGGVVLDTIIKNFMQKSIPTVDIVPQSNIVNMGDIIVHGGAAEQTVSEIRRAQREQVNTLLKEFNKLR